MNIVVEKVVTSDEIVDFLRAKNMSIYETGNDCVSFLGRGFFFKFFLQWSIPLMRSMEEW